MTEISNFHQIVGESKIAAVRYRKHQILPLQKHWPDAIRVGPVRNKQLTDDKQSILKYPQQLTNETEHTYAPLQGHEDLLSASIDANCIPLRASWSAAHKIRWWKTEELDSGAINPVCVVL